MNNENINKIYFIYMILFKGGRYCFLKMKFIKI